MKSIASRILTLLVSACLAFSSSVVGTLVTLSPNQQLSNFTSITLSGWFHLLWGVPRDAAGPGELFYLLVDDRGRSYTLDLGAIGKPGSASTEYVAGLAVVLVGLAYVFEYVRKRKRP